MAESRYMNFDARKSESGKTAVIIITTKADGSLLGSVRWHAPWRRYAFYPFHDTIFDVACMTDIQALIHELTQSRQHDAV